MDYRLTIKNINDLLDEMYFDRRSLFRFVLSKEQKSYPEIVSNKDPRKRDTRKRGFFPVTSPRIFNHEIESHFSRNENAKTKMTGSDLLYFFMGGNYRLVTDTTFMNHLINATPNSTVFFDPVIEDLVNWKLVPDRDGDWAPVDIRKGIVPNGAVSVIDYIVQENDYIISSFCSQQSQEDLRNVLKDYAINICEDENKVPEWTLKKTVEPFADLVTMDQGLVQKLAEYLDLMATLAEVSEANGGQARYLAQGLTWLLIASLLRGKFSAVSGELNRAFTVSRSKADSLGIVETEDLSGTGRRVFVDSGTALYMKLMNRFHYIRDRHPSIRMMEPDPDLFPKGLPAIRNSERKASEGDGKPVSIKDMVMKSWAEHKHLLLVGEGGIGKTVAMLTLPDEEWLRELQLPALYIPLQGLDSYKGDLTSYIEDSYPNDMKKINALAATPWEEHPQMLLLLDGFNEIPIGYREAAEVYIRAWMDRPGVQVITTSRISFFLKDRFLEYRLEPLPEKAIRTFLLSSGLSEGGLPGKGDPLWKVINVPLMLTMFVQTDRVRGAAGSSDVLLDWKESNSAAHIIWNYLQMELYRFVSIAGSGNVLSAAAILAMAPYVCFEMAKDGKFYAEQGDFKDIIRKAVRFFSQNPDMIPGQVRDICDYFDGVSIEEAFDDRCCEFYLSLLSKESALIQKEVTRREEAADGGRKLEIIYVPAHQNFRDALAAIFISTCMLNSARKKLPFPEEILSTADFYVKNYIAEFLSDSEMLKIWDYHRASEPENGRVTWILMDIIGRQRDYDYRELNFSGLDLTEINLHRLLSKRLDICPLPEKAELFINTSLRFNSFVPEGHSDSVESVAFSQNGRLLASASYDHTIRVWNLETGDCHVLKGHSDIVESVSFSPDGRLLASGSWDYTVRVWDLGTDECRVLKGHSGIVESVSFSLNGRMIASGSWDHTVRIWNLGTDEYRVLKGHSGIVESVSFSPNGRMIASGSSDKTVRVWDLGTDECRVLKGHSGIVEGVSFSPDGRFLASGSDDQTVRLWNLEGGLCHIFKGHSRPVTSVAYSPNGRMLASGSDDQTVRLWNLEGGECRVLERFSSAIFCVTFSPSGRFLASGLWDNTVRIWDIKGRGLRVFEGHSCPVRSIAFSPNGRFLASGSDDQTVRLWNLEDSGSRILKDHSGSVYSVAFSPDSRLLASGSWDNTICVWDLERCKRRILKGHSSSVFCVAFSPNSRMIASGSSDETVRVWDLEGDECFILKDFSRSVTSITFSSNGKMLAGGLEDSTVRVWDLEHGGCRVLKGHSGSIYCVAFSPDCRLLASGSDDNTVRIWDLEGGRCHVLEGHSDSVFSVSFNPNGGILASSSLDDTVRLWNLEDETTIDRIRLIKGINLCDANFEMALIPENDKELLKESGAII